MTPSRPSFVVSLLVISPLLARPIPSVAGAEPVAIVCWVQGQAVVVAADRPTPLALFARLPAGVLVETRAGSEVRLVFANGERYRLLAASRGRVTRERLEGPRGSVERLSPVPAVAALRPLMFDGEIRSAAAVRFRAPATLPAADSAPPVTIVVPDHAVLSLAPREATRRYRVEVDDEGGRRVLSVASAGAQVALPRGVLKAGGLYYWRAEPVGGGAAISGLLKALTSEEVRAREELRRWIVASPEPDLEVLLAEVDRALGLRP